MQTIRYSYAFDCLILEREGGRLSYIERDGTIEHLFRVLKHYASVDGPSTEADARVPQETAAFLIEKWKKEGNLVKANGRIDLKEIGL